MIEIIDKSKCAGCTACYTVCPHNAITMRNDDLGFLYPEVNEKLCVNCNLCDKVCFYRSEVNLNKPRAIYGARNKNISELSYSRSGAIFPVLYSYIIKRNGFVFGASFNEKLEVVHISATDIQTCLAFKGSKYVQSYLGDSFRKIIDYLKEGRIVLFSGTPCQVAGLKKVVPPKILKNLYTVDIICHGVPSPSLYKDYIVYQEDKHHSKITEFKFRDKKINGWHDHKESFLLNNGRRIVECLYTDLFYTNCFFRDSCYNCEFAATSRVSDITLGDFWGWENVNSQFNKDDKGCSLLFINSKKGEMLLAACSEEINMFNVNNIEDCLQRNLQHPTPEPVFRKEFLEIYKKEGFAKLINYIFYPSFIQRLVRKIKRVIL